MAETFAIGMDLGGTNARAAAVDLSGRILHVAKEKLAKRTPEAAVEALAACVDRTLSALGRTPYDCAGFGLGLAGQIDARTNRVIVAPNLGWRDLDFGGPLSARLGRPVRLVNDVAAAGLGESKAGAARGYSDALLVFVGTGIGSALILGGRLHRGTRGLAGELGHTKVPWERGRLCACGEVGCLEAYAGGRSLESRVAEAVAAGRATILKTAGRRRVRPSVSAIDRAADEGDELARELRDEAALLIGVAAANLVTELNPAVLILGGGVLTGAPTLRKRVEETIRAATGSTDLAECGICAPAAPPCGDKRHTATPEVAWKRSGGRFGAGTSSA